MDGGMQFQLSPSNNNKRTLPQYSHLLTALTHDSEKAKFFDCNDSRLDHFLFDKFSFKMSTELQSVLKLILVLSNRQERLEGGFNDNKSVLKIRKKEKSVMSPRLILNNMQKSRSILSTFKLRNKLVRCVKSSWQLYELGGERQKKSAKQDESNERLKILKSEIKDVMREKQRFLEVCENLNQEFVCSCIQSSLTRF